MRIRDTFLTALLCTASAALCTGDDEYARSRLLLEPSDLAKPRVARQFVVLDASKKEAYDKEHIPGARWVDHDAWKSAFGDGTDTKEWSQRIGDLGISTGKVVVYDDLSAKNAARIWWILRYWGVKDVRLLNGGMKTWRARELPTDAKEPSPVKAVQFTAKARKRQLATKDQILASLTDKSLQIVDARSTDEFCGIELKENKRGGAIPGARHLEWGDLIDPATECFKPASELQRLFDQAGIHLEQPSASHCQSGGRASVMVFGLELMGAKNARNYFPGWSEWGNSDDLPIVVPKKQ